MERKNAMEILIDTGPRPTAKFTRMPAAVDPAGRAVSSVLMSVGVAFGAVIMFMCLTGRL